MSDPFGVTQAQMDALVKGMERWKISRSDMWLDELHVVPDGEVKDGSYIGYCTLHGRDTLNCHCFQGHVSVVPRGMFIGIEKDGYSHS